MNIVISNANGQPIYEQIYGQIKNEIVSEALHEGDALPSIRSLAKDLRISVITTKRAYDELEREGFIYMVAGKGCYVARQNTELIREMNLKKIEDYLRKVSELAKTCNLTLEEASEMLRIIWEE